MPSTAASYSDDAVTSTVCVTPSRSLYETEQVRSKMQAFHKILLLFALCGTLFPMALRECRLTFQDVRDIDHSVTVHAETTMDAAALGLKRIREQKFVTEELSDPITSSGISV